MCWMRWRRFVTFEHPDKSLVHFEKADVLLLEAARMCVCGWVIMERASQAWDNTTVHLQWPAKAGSFPTLLITAAATTCCCSQATQNKNMIELKKFNLVNETSGVCLYSRVSVDSVKHRRRDKRFQEDCIVSRFVSSQFVQMWKHKICAGWGIHPFIPGYF